MIFPNSIYLKENKRLKSEAEKQTLKQFKADIFNKDISIKTSVTKYFKLINDIKTTDNIALQNEVCDMVSKTVRKLQQRKTDYEVGETLICRKYLKMKMEKAIVKFNVNYEYEIININAKELIIKDRSSDKS